MAKHNNIRIPQSWVEKKTAGKEWMRSFYIFLYRNQELSIRKPDACSLSRLTSSNKHNVTVFFKYLESILKRCLQLADGSRVFNLDETSLTTMQKSKKSYSTQGSKATKLVTLLVGILGAATFIPQVMIFPRKNFKQYIRMNNGAPTGTLGLASLSWQMKT